MNAKNINDILRNSDVLKKFEPHKSNSKPNKQSIKSELELTNPAEPLRVEVMYCKNCSKNKTKHEFYASNKSKCIECFKSRVRCPTCSWTGTSANLNKHKLSQHNHQGNQMKKCSVCGVTTIDFKPGYKKCRKCYNLSQTSKFRTTMQSCTATKTNPTNTAGNRAP